MYLRTIPVFIISLIAAATTSSIPLHKRIVGGTRVKVAELPSFVQLNGCGGALIGPQTIVTAGHCFEAEPDSAAYLGGVNIDEGKLLKPVKAITHPEFDIKKLVNDIGLVFLSEKVDGPYALIEGIPYPEAGSKLMVAGYGRTSTNGPTSKILLKVQMNIGNETDCAEHNTEGGNIFDPITQICATDRLGFSDCMGDSGGPLYSGSGENLNIVRVVSSSGDIEACGENGAYSYYTFSKPYVPWIKSEIEKFEKNGLNAITEVRASM